MTQPIKPKSLGDVRISLGNLQAMRIRFMGKTECFFCTFSKSMYFLTKHAQMLASF
jgi:hypothetical protein